MRIVVAAFAVLSVAACAKAPENIAAAPISEVAYQSHACPRLGQEAARVAAALADASEKQRKARQADTAGVIILGLPMASVTGNNHEKEVARLKGEQEAVRRVSAKKGCSAPAASAARAAT